MTHNKLTLSKSEVNFRGGADTAGDAVGQILPRGHVIHGYGSSSNERVIKILDQRVYSDSAPLLGFGVDGNAERALARALFSYLLREQDEVEFIKADTYPSISEGKLPTGHHPSRFDNIVWGSDFRLYQADDVVIAGSSYGGNHGMSRLEVADTSAVKAITMLADNYRFIGLSSSRIRDLPPISFE
jgi:hypothetical protein